MKWIAVMIGIICVVGVGALIYKKQKKAPLVTSPLTSQQKKTSVDFPLAVQTMRNRTYPGSDITIEQTLEPGSNYSKYLTSYKSDGLKIYALLTVPKGEKPKAGFPVIVFNHGYIPPEVYRTTERYIAYVDAFARNGYIVFKPDYRGNGSSEGQPEGAYFSPAYTVDDLNAISSVKKFKDADPSRLGVWGHSMGGNITLRDIVTDVKGIKAAVIWGGVVGSYDDILNHWRRDRPFQPSQREGTLRARQRQRMKELYGTPQSNPAFWNAIDPTAFAADITVPVQLHHGEADGEVPVAFSQTLYDKLKAAGKTVEFYTYPGADHNISEPSFNTAIQRSITFFDTYLKS